MNKKKDVISNYKFNSMTFTCVYSGCPIHRRTAFSPPNRIHAPCAFKETIKDI